MRFIALFAQVLIPALSAPPPSNFAALECAVNTFAASLATAKAPPHAAAAIIASFNLDVVCNTTAAPPLAPAVPRALAREAARVAALRAGALASAVPASPAATFFVAPGGSDANPGTQGAPFATLECARAAAASVTPRAPGDVVVYLRAGTYYLGDAPLILGAGDSNVTWSAFPGDASPPVLSGARLLSGLQWAPAAGLPAGVLVAPLAVEDPRRDAWFAAHPGWAGAGPPPRVASLFINGVRQQRARFPNAFADDASGICFSATQRPGEGCAGWSSAALGDTGSQPAPAGARVDVAYPDRGDSPTLGCTQCHVCGKFGYSVYPYPPDHPVYTAPLPGIGWSNLSLFSFFGSPFSRPAGVRVDAKQWSPRNYSDPRDAVVHMFHGGLWGGWQYAVSSVAQPKAAAPEFPPAPPLPTAAAVFALPAGARVWLRADDLKGAVPDGGAVELWPDAAGAHPARPASAASAPIFRAAGFPGGLPSVFFNGTAALLNGDLAIYGDDLTVFAVVRDAGSATSYGSGVFFARDSFVGLGTKRVTVAQAASDDDPAPPGSVIPALMLDWPGSPADPGHRSLARPALLSAVFASGGVLGFVDGCFELGADPHSAKQGAMGYEVGSRNSEDGRYLVGDVAELIVFDRMLNASERAGVNEYLWAKWGLPPHPKKCEAPPDENPLVIEFGYGGYQEARGSGINKGQRFYLENVLEELDNPGEFFYDLRKSLLYVFPNASVDVRTAELAIPLADRVVSIVGAPGVPATGITLNGVTVTQSRATFLEMYEMPSGGDWGLHRGGAVFVQDAEGVAIVNCTFAYTGGNGLFFSNHVTHSAVNDSEFTHTGDSGVVFAGSTVGQDGSAPTYPNWNTVARNQFHEVGRYGKQTSCFAQQLTANSTVLDNTCFNGPRAGVNYNDGFGGGHVFQGNVVWNMVRETGDHGPLNSWDRQPYWTKNGVDDGFNDPAGRSFIRAWDQNSNNLMINGYNGVWTFDHDDCSQMVRDENNFMAWGGCKNFLGNHKACSSNVILYPGVGGRSAGDRRCQTDDNGVFALQFHHDNICTSADGRFYSFADCNATSNNFNTTCYNTQNNTLYVDAGASFEQDCARALGFTEWQNFGQDSGSATAATPPIAQLIALGAAKVLGGLEG